ncbi:MAG: hypothetical protein FWF59_12715 [Turicibacter sp.]|nr:hypothetical protein [Turicibacter sp.]
MDKIYLTLEKNVKKTYLLSALGFGLFGCLNMLLNLGEIYGFFGGNGWSVALSFIGNFISIFIVLAFWIVCISVIYYFLSAIVGQLLHIKEFVKLSVCIFSSAFIIAICDTAAFLIIGTPWSAQGFLGMGGYLPFYVLFYLLSIKFLAKIGTYTQFQRIAMTLVTTIGLVFLMLP